MSTEAQTDIDAQYRQLREDCGVAPPGPVRVISVQGDEAADYLQGQLTNDLESLDPGTGCYAALLDRKAHFQADMTVLRTKHGFELLIDPQADDKAFKHLSMYKIGRNVTVDDRSSTVRLLRVAGPKLEEVTGARPGPPSTHQPARIAGAACTAVSAPIGTLPAIDLLVPVEDCDHVHQFLLDAGAQPVDPEALEILRIEAAIPRFGKEITSEHMPAEVGIVDRAVSFTKGCYIGQEPVARLHYRGRPNRMLCSLQLDRVVDPGTEVFHGEKQVGTVSSVAISPASGIRGLGILRREAEPGVELTDQGGAPLCTVLTRHSGDSE